MPSSSPQTDPAGTSEKILRSAAELMRSAGIDALSTRTVAAAAGVAPPVIYRQFGTKKRLLDATTQFVFERYIAEKRTLMANSADPLCDLERLWDLHVDFALTNPQCWMLAYVRRVPGAVSGGAAQTFALLQQVVARLGNQGRLRVSVERATGLIRSAAMGVVLALMPLPALDRDLRISRNLRDSTLSAIIHHDEKLQATSPDISSRAAALHQEMCGSYEVGLSSAERSLLGEWLIRLADNA